MMHVKHAAKGLQTKKIAHIRCRVINYFMIKHCICSSNFLTALKLLVS